MIALFTDFGVADPYVGQMHAILARDAPGVPIVDLFHSVPNFDIRAGAYLLPALSAVFPRDSVFVCVVDPGVGGSRRALALRVDRRWYVGPDNGLFHVLVRRATECECRTIDWRPDTLSASFHGRDLFAPVAAGLARGAAPTGAPTDPTVPAGAWPDDLPTVVYLDHYGNAVTGMRAAALDRTCVLSVGGRRLRYARVYTEVAPGEIFWYENANGLVEIAMRQGDCAAALGLTLGAAVAIAADAG